MMVHPALQIAGSHHMPSACDRLHRLSRARAAGMIETLVVVIIILIVVLLLIEMTRKPEATNSPTAQTPYKTGAKQADKANTPPGSP